MTIPGILVHRYFHPLRNCHVAHQYRDQAVQAAAYHNGEFISVTHESLKGKWSVFVFYPADFTSSARRSSATSPTTTRFQKLGVEIYESPPIPVHAQGWHDTSETIRKVQYPLIADPTLALSRSFGCSSRKRPACRGTFVIDPSGRVKVMEITTTGLAVDARELLRKCRPRNTSPRIRAKCVPRSGRPAPHVEAFAGPVGKI